MKAIKLLLSITFVALLFTACNTHVVKTENLNVRSAPSKEAKVIGQLHHNDRVKVTPHNEAWGQIEYEDQTGYVAMKHMVTKKVNFKSNVLITIVILVVIIITFGGTILASLLRVFAMQNGFKFNKDGTVDKRSKAYKDLSKK